MRKVLKDPLAHFLVLGLGLFAVFAWVSKDDASGDDGVIVVDRAALLSHIQYHARAFSPEAASAHLDGMPESELERLVDAYVREQVLYREALALGMDRTDHVIKHRLVQSIEFITDDLALRTTEVSDEDLETYFSANRERYRIEPTVTFTHVFFNSERHGREETRVLAQKKLAELNRDGVPFTDAPGHGDRFLYLVNYVERTPDLVASHFGREMADAVFALAPDAARWVGPLESRYGHHLLLVTGRTEERAPELAEVEARVRADAEREAAEKRRDSAIQALIDTYEVRREVDRLPSG
ncbi:MAG: peptidyl-prolyl cis-trans isomerase [Pseudomonadales bacterium]|nr:peptidyl-prolyl cis-trans isomerase [Pseudomonadales bacterium]